jgi:hypothetical protein
MNLRIDFDKYKKPVEETVSCGLLTENIKQLMPQDMQLKSVTDLIENDCCIYWVSNGNWSMHELLVALLSITGAADVYISTYALGETPGRIVAQLKSSGMIKTLHTVIDSRVDVRTANSFQLISAISDEVALVDTHAKVTAIVGDTMKIAVIGSANYTENNRYECGIITTNNKAVDMQIDWITKALNNGNK